MEVQEALMENKKPFSLTKQLVHPPQSLGLAQELFIPHR